MTWNWQNPDWPNFTWDRSRMTAAEEQFLLGAGVVIGTVKHLSEDDHKQLLVEVMSGEALTTSEIEGEILNRGSVQSSIQRQLGLAANKRGITPAEQGIAEMMVDLYRSFSQPVSSEMLYAWHTMVTSGRRDLIDVGRYRISQEPMQIVSGPIGNPKVHFRLRPRNKFGPKWSSSSHGSIGRRHEARGPHQRLPEPA
jgi:Fic family protein